MKKGISYLLFFVFSIALYLLYVNPSTNDDIFVYFNYARNFSEGRFFAIDYRNIPSEGFSSVLYMLMLVPFELAHINSMFGGIFLNYIAIFGISLYSYKILSILCPNKIKNSVFVSIFFIILVSHSDIIGIAGWAFETIYSGFLFVLILYILFSSKDIGKKNNFIVIIYIISFLIRPENIIIFFPVIFWSSFELKKLNEILFFGLKILCGVVSVFMFKFFLFRDFFPTGFYRKFINQNTEISSGFRYVYDWFNAEAFFPHLKNWFLIFALLIFIFILFLKNKKDVFKDRIFQFFVLSLSVMILNVLFCLKTTPMIGLYNRYLILSNVALMLFVFFIFGSLISKILSVRVLHFVNFLLLPIFVLITIKETGFHKAKENIMILSKLKNQADNHPYLRFGNFIRKNFADHKSLVISMVDGGALPYSARCNTIDPAGLTEPFIARLAAYKGVDKVQKYSSYIFSKNVDMFCIITGKMSDSTRRDEGCFPEQNVPLNPEQMVEFYSRLVENKFVYVSTISGNLAEGLPYDIHITLKSDSKHYNSLKTIILDYCKVYGYTKIHDFTVSCRNHRAVFPNAGR